MNDQPAVSHAEWDELAAGHALDALEPAEDQRLAAHLAVCARCRHNLDDYALVAAQLGSLADEEDPAPAWHRVRPIALADIAESAESAEFAESAESAGASTPHRDHRLVRPSSPAPALWRRPRVLAASVIVLLIVAGAIGWQAGARSRTTPAAAALRACQQQAGCHMVTLHDARSGSSANDRAAIVVDAGRASLVPLKLAAAPDAQMYVLWQLPRDRSPVAITTFRLTDRQTPSTALAAQYTDTAAFAISLEPNGSALRRPTDILALGAARA
jgi:anti-sigma-K factor RskA